MKVSFHLARQTSPRETAIIAVIRFGGERVNFGTGLSIIPKHWNKLSREARATKGISHLELNSTLSRTKNRIEEAFRRYRNDTGNIPSKTTFKEILNTEFERRSAQKESKLTFIQFFESIILS